jgi:hypothetical protein
MSAFFWLEFNLIGNDKAYLRANIAIYHAVNMEEIQGAQALPGNYSNVIFRADKTLTIIQIARGTQLCGKKQRLICFKPIQQEQQIFPLS